MPHIWSLKKNRWREPKVHASAVNAEFDRLRLSIGYVRDHHMKLGVTDHGYVCVVHEDTDATDLVYRLVNCDLPVILRRRAQGFRFIGEIWMLLPPSGQVNWTNHYGWASEDFDKGLWRTIEIT